MISDAAVSAIVAGIVPTLIAIGTLIQSIRNGKKADDAATKAEVVAKEVSQTKVATDGHLSALKSDLAMALARIEEMQTATVVAKDTSDKAIAAALATPTHSEEAPR